MIIQKEKPTPNMDNELSTIFFMNFITFIGFVEYEIKIYEELNF